MVICGGGPVGVWGVCSRDWRILVRGGRREKLSKGFEFRSYHPQTQQSRKPCYV